MLGSLALPIASQFLQHTPFEVRENPMTKRITYSVFALALLTTTVGCPPPAAPKGDDVDISTDAPAEVSDNTTAVTEVPSDNMTTGSETP